MAVHSDENPDESSREPIGPEPRLDDHRIQGKAQDWGLDQVVLWRCHWGLVLELLEKLCQSDARKFKVAGFLSKTR